jgi:DNA-binding CsgD family transcriptional regulator
MSRPAEDKLDDETRVLVSVAKRQWERTFDAISEPLMLVDPSYVIRRANLALADELGMAIQRVVGQKCHEVRAASAQRFIGSGASPCTGCPVAEAQRCGVAADGEVRSAHGRTYILRAFPVLDEVDTERLTVCHYHDVTDERVMTYELASAERLAAIGRLAGGVAHEINNPLGGILALTALTLDHTAMPALSLPEPPSPGEAQSIALRLGASGYILKRSTGKELLKAVRDVLAGRIYVAPELTAAIEDPQLRKAIEQGRVPVLTTRQQEILRLIASGKSNREIADFLHITVKTVRWHRLAIAGKLGMSGTAALTRYAITHGFIGTPKECRA